MAAGYDIGASSSTSSGAQGGNITNGDFVVGGSGGASTGIPAVAIIAIGVLVVLGFFVFLLRKK